MWINCYQPFTREIVYLKYFKWKRVDSLFKDLDEALKDRLVVPLDFVWG